MKKDEIIRVVINDPKVRRLNIKERFICVMGGAYRECEQDFARLEGLTWPNGHGILISKSKQQIENSFASAIAEQIPETPYFFEVGHSKKDLKRLAEMVFVLLGYSPGLRNEVKRFLEPPTRNDLMLRLDEL